jgi:glutamate 5-kinase
MKKKNRELWIVKAGSQMVIDGGPMLIRSWMNQVDDLAKSENIDIIWVTSGAIASAKKISGKSALNIAEKQALSAIGQPHVINQYLVALGERGRKGAQVLLTADDIASSKRRLHLSRSLTTLLKWKYLPILNENDAVSIEEIQFGDNDRLSALVAIHMKASRLILLTDVDGLYDKDPKRLKEKETAKLIPHLLSVKASLLKSLSKSSKSEMGKGGMYSKLLAAKMVSSHGITCHLVKGDLPNALLNITSTPSGTRIDPKPRKGALR